MQYRFFPLVFAVLTFFTVTLLVSTSLSAQKIELEDYQRAMSFTYKKVNDKQVFNIYMKQQYFADGSGLWQLNHAKDGKRFEVVWFDSLIRQPLFNHEVVAQNLEAILGKTTDPLALPFDQINKKRGSKIEVGIAGKTYQIDLITQEVIKNSGKNEIVKDRMISYSPDSSLIAYVEDYNLFLKSPDNNELFPLSTDGKEKFEYGNPYGWYDLMQGENGQRPINFEVNWSPDSKWLWTNASDLNAAKKMYLLDWSVDSLYRPQLYSYYRGSPGDTTMVYETPVFYSAQTKKEITPRLQPRTHINGYRIEWIKGSDHVLIVDSERGYKKLNFYLLNLNSGELELLFSESSTTRVGNKLEVEIFHKEKTFVFTSERSGWNQLYSYDIVNRKLKALTKGEFVVNDIVRADSTSKKIFYLASGVDKKMNPYHQQFYSIQLNGKGQKLLTPEPVHHEVKISSDGQYFVDKISSITEPATYVLRASSNGERLVTLGKADASGLISKNWKAPMPFEALGRDGKTKIYGALWRPTNFDPNQSYPIIDNTYTGPHTQMFPTSYGEAFWGHQALAELGFIVMKVDGMGTNGRSKAFQDVSYKNMGNNLVDHIGAIQQLAKKYSWLDTTRVGIYGHSAGGFDTGHALLAFPDFYKVGVASSADHDFRMEKAWWPEMYMGWPVDSSYHKVSNITMAGNLKGKLLIVHGGMDENVNPSASFKLAEALIKSNKDFDMLIMPSQHHGYRGIYRDYFNKKRWNYFVEHLLGADPIWDFDTK